MRLSDQWFRFSIKVQFLQFTDIANNSCPDTEPGTELSGELISIIIPSLNEESHIGMALRSIKEQDYPDLEVILVDSFSKDKTREIAAGFGVRIVDYPGKVLGARLEGLKRSTGQWVMFLDADQILQPKAIHRCVEQIRKHDMVVLGERSYQPANWVQRGLDRQRQFLEREAMEEGVGYYVFPRFFRRDLLEFAYSQVPEELVSCMGNYEDSLLYSKMLTRSTDTVIVPEGVWHNEEANAMELYRHKRKFGSYTRANRSTIKVETFHRSKSKLQGMMDALRHRYLLVSLIKELGFQVGYRF
jgi:glycosyltransferase involved in cell wall biosynthesis